MEKDKSGYDDHFFHTSIIPNMKCKSCGESTLSKGGNVQQVQTKYPEGFQI